MECGLSRSTGFGTEPVTWQEVRAWAETVFIENAWTLISVHRLSETYVEFLREAKSPTCPSPMIEDIDVQRETVSKQLQRFKRNRGR